MGNVPSHGSDRNRTDRPQSETAPGRAGGLESLLLTIRAVGPSVILAAIALILALSLGVALIRLAA